MSYNDLIREIVQEASDIIGAVAIRKAAELDGVQAVEGELRFDAEMGAEELEQLIDLYSGIIGKAVDGIIRRVLASYDGSLPDDLSEQQLLH